MRVLLMQCLQYRVHETTPYRTDGRGGHTFWGVGSHVLHSHWNNRWLAFAFEVATIDQTADSVLESTEIRMTSEDTTVVPKQSILEWEPEHRHPTKDSKYSSYRWQQQIFIEAENPGLVSLHIEMKFSDQPSPLTVEGQTHILIDLHLGKPPKYYSKPRWYIKKYLG